MNRALRFLLFLSLVLFAGGGVRSQPGEEPRGPGPKGSQPEEQPKSEPGTQPKSEPRTQPKSETQAPPKDEPDSNTKEGFADSWLDGFSVFGSVRLRPEFHGNHDFDKRTDDVDEFVGQRVQLGVEKKWGEDFIARITLQDSRVWGGQPGSDVATSTANAGTSESTDVREAWLGANHLFTLPLSLELGRQIFSYGDQRQIGAGEFTNVGRSFDALRFRLETKYWDTHLFGAVLAEEDSDAGGNNTAVGSANPSGIRFICDPASGACAVTAATPRELDDAYFSGLHNTLRVRDLFSLDLYAFGIHKKWIRRTTPLPGVPGAEIMSQDRTRQRDNLYTVGGRLSNQKRKGELRTADGPFDFSVEYASQTGSTGEEIAASWDYLRLTVAKRDVLGNIITDASGKVQTDPVYVEKRKYGGHLGVANAGFTWREFRLGAEVVVSSGDPNRTDGVTSTYRSLFPTGHMHNGQADLIGFGNMKGASVDLHVKLGRFGRVQFAYWQFQKHKNQDGWYDVAGSLKSGASTESAANARFGNQTSSAGVFSRGVGLLRRDLFREYDLTYWFDYKQLSIVAAYSLVHAGDSIGDVKDDVLSPQATRRPSFDPRADYAFVMFILKF